MASGRGSHPHLRWAGLLFCVGAGHVLVGSLLVALALLGGLLTLRPWLGAGLAALGIVLVGPFCALLAALRLRLPMGTWRQGALREAGMAMALAGVLAAGAPALLAALGLLPALAGASPGGLVGAVTSLLLAAPAYLLLRGALAVGRSLA